MKENGPLMFIENVQKDNINPVNQDYFDSRNKAINKEKTSFIDEKNIIKDNFLFFEKCYKAQKIGVNITINLELNTSESVTGIVKNISKDEVLIDNLYLKISEVVNKKIVKTEII